MRSPARFVPALVAATLTASAYADPAFNTLQLTNNSGGDSNAAAVSDFNVFFLRKANNGTTVNVLNKNFATPTAQATSWGTPCPAPASLARARLWMAWDGSAVALMPRGGVDGLWYASGINNWQQLSGPAVGLVSSADLNLRANPLLWVAIPTWAETNPEVFSYTPGGIITQKTYGLTVPIGTPIADAQNLFYVRQGTNGYNQIFAAGVGKPVSASAGLTGSGSTIISSNPNVRDSNGTAHLAWQANSDTTTADIYVCNFPGWTMTSFDAGSGATFTRVTTAQAGTANVMPGFSNHALVWSTIDSSTPTLAGLNIADADGSNPRALASHIFVNNGTPYVAATGRLISWVENDTTAQTLTIKSVSDSDLGTVHTVSSFSYAGSTPEAMMPQMQVVRGVSVSWSQYVPSTSHLQVFAARYEQNVTSGNSWDATAPTSDSSIILQTNGSFTGPSATASVSSLTVTSGTTLQLQNGSTLSTDDGMLIQSGGSLHGNGTIGGDLTNQGSFSPGNSPGFAHITADYTDSGTLTMEINGLDQGDLASHDGIGYDYILAEGNATISGALNVALLDGYVPSAGDSYTILHASLISVSNPISFPALPDGMAWSSQIISDAGGQSLVLTVTPEPTSLSLLALASVALLRKRSRS